MFANLHYFDKHCRTSYDKAKRKSNGMPEVKIANKLSEEKMKLAEDIGNLYPRLTGDELMEVALETGYSTRTIHRYTTEVKKLAVGQIIKSAMDQKIADRKAA